MAAIPHVKIGLDQKLSMPTDSYVLHYFEDIEKYLAVGPPVYFVVRSGFDYSDPVKANKICSLPGCDDDSLMERISGAARRPHRTFIARPAMSWVDDYIEWLSPETSCCGYDSETGDFCPSYKRESDKEYEPCAPTYNTSIMRPSVSDFNKFIDIFLHDNPNDKCSKGGHAAYSSAVELMGGSKVHREIGATHFMAWHSVLKTSDDFTGAVREARRLADEFNERLNGTGYSVFAYSNFYVFYEQYLDMVETTITNLGLCGIAIFLVSFVLLGFDFYSAFIVIVVIAMIVVDMFGIMYLWDIDLNAISLVNMVMAIGIAVEFCSHFVRKFAHSQQPNRLGRMTDTVTHIGSSVFSGITLTKLGGIVVLAFAKSRLFQVINILSFYITC